MKKVLVIAFVYPPLGGSGVQRTLKFTRYMPEFGWQPVVVCSDESEIFGQGLDTSLLAEIPSEGKVLRRRFVHPLGFRRRAKRVLGIQPNVLISDQELPTMTEGDSGKGTMRKISKFVTRLVSPFEYPPVDAALYWSLMILPDCLRLIQQEKIDLIFTTSFPYSDHLTGIILKRLTHLPWVADFRDPWTQNDSARNQGWRRKVDLWAEQRVLNNADRVICVTPTYTHEMHKLAPTRKISDFITIENGYDQTDFNISTQELHNTDQLTLGPDPIIHSKPITLAHIGHLYDGTALPFLQAVKEIGGIGANLIIRFVGGMAAQEKRWLGCNSVSAVVSVEPRLPHAQAVREMRSAVVLMLFLLGGAGNSGHYPGKLFEYMASGRPILLVGPPGDAARLIEASGTGCAVNSYDREKIIEILTLIAVDPSEFLSRFYQPRLDMIRLFERRALTKKLSDVFSMLINPD